MPQSKPTNEEIAQVLERIADLLEMQDENPFRIRAYRNGASSVKQADESLADMVREEGTETLQDLPNIGEGLASAIAEYVNRGRSSMLDRLEAEVSPADLFAQVPGIGEELAQRVATELDIDSLEELEQAAHDGRLEEIEGFGPKRVETVQVGLAGMLSRAAQRRFREAASGEEAEKKSEPPPVDLLLEIDAEYRRRAEAGELRKIAPRRFNPEGEAWLPIMNAEREGWEFTVLYSNTARAHELGTTHDWVVIYYRREGIEDQVTVVTETSGPLGGKRVVRGREAECRDYYA
jgi:Holliday junction resolvasome RuvABC DNA-binding subunit